MLKHVFIKVLLHSNASVLKEYKGTYGVYYIKMKVKALPYTLLRRGVPVREGTYPEPSACEVGWPVPFLATFISPPGTHLLLGEQ